MPSARDTLADRRRAQLVTAGQSHERRSGAAPLGRASVVAPGEGQPVAARELQHPHRRRRRARADDRQAEPLDRCSASRLAMKVDSTRSLSGPSSKSSARIASRSTAM